MVTGFGSGRAALVAGMRAGDTAIRPVSRFDTAPYGGAPAALVPGFDDPPMRVGQTGPGQALMVAFAVDAGRQALEHAAIAPDELGLVIGTNIEDRPAPHAALLERIGDALGVDGPRISTSIACASAASALDVAARMLTRGDVSAVLVGGADAITPWVMGGFHVVGALASGPCTPFGDRSGMSLGEGAALFVLEREDRARARGATILARLGGVGLAADAHHATSPAPDGRGITMAILRSGVDFTHYVNAHGTGTEANDAPEVLGIRAALGDPPTSSGKGLLGHAQGAAAALEIATVLLAADQGAVPPTWGSASFRPGAPVDPIPGALRPGAPTRWVKLSAAFGGACAAVAFGSPRPTDQAPVYLGGLSAVGPHGVGLAGLEDGWLAGGAFDRAAAEAVARRSDLAREDPSGVLAMACAIGALDASGVRLRRAERASVGVVLGRARGSESTHEALQRQIDADGPIGMQAGTFARACMVAAGGLVSRELGLLGPLDVVGCGGLSSLVALVRAAELVASGGLRGVLALSTCEHGRWAGGVGAWLSGTPGDVRVAGWSLGPAGALDATIARAGGRGMPRVDATADDDSGVEGGVRLIRAAAVCRAEGAAVLAGAWPGGASAALVLRA